MKHILFISTGFPTSYQPLNGIFYLDQAEALVKEGNKAGFIAIIPTSIKDFISKGWKDKGSFEKNINGVNCSGEIYVQIPKYFSQQFNRTLKSGKKYFIDYISKHGKPDIIHLQGFEGGKLAVWIQQEYKISYVITEHSSRFLNNSLKENHLQFAKEIFKKAAHRIAVSQSFSEKLIQISKQKFEVIPNIVDTDFFKPGNSPSDFVFLSAGILNENKNQILQINSFLKIAEEFPNAVLHIAGDGERKDFLLQYIADKKHKERIHFTGWLNRNQLAEAMQKASLFLISSKYESFGVVAVEAMSCGLPVISTPCGGPESIILNGKNGFITNGTDSDFADKMCEVLRNNQLFNKQFIRDYAVNNFSSKAVCKQLSDVYSHYILK